MSSAAIEKGPSGPVRVDRYLVFDELGRGGMARVHLARLYGPVSFSRVVAMKRLLGDQLDARDASMLIDEARLGARIRHPNVVSVIDVVRTDAELALVMEYVHGPALAWLLRRLVSRAQTMPIPIALRITLDTLYGLHAAHEARSERGESLGLIHRDVSPQNILVGSDGLSRLADFGIAKAAGKLVRTQGNELRGKVRYMAPEQLRGARVDRRLDLFSTGVVFWEMLTSRPLFQPSGDHFVAICTSLLSAPIPSPSQWASVPPPLEAALMRALERDPDARYRTAEELAGALEQAATPASHGEVARWLAAIASDFLEERAARIERIEQVSEVVPTTAPPSPPPAPPAPTVRKPELTTDVMQHRSAELGTDTLPMDRRTFPLATPLPAPVPSPRALHASPFDATLRSPTHTPPPIAPAAVAPPTAARGGRVAIVVVTIVLAVVTLGALAAWLATRR